MIGMQLNKRREHRSRGCPALQRRLASLLGWLAAKPFLNGRQLVVACRYARIGYPLEAIGSLERLGLASHLAAPGAPDTSLRRYYHITRRGINALARRQEATAKDIAKRYWLSSRRLAMLARALGHTGACHQFFVDMILHAEKVQDPLASQGLILWHGEAEAYRRYRLDGIDRGLRPDAFGGYRSGDREVFFLLEWDSGNMAAGRHRRKLLAYHDYRVWWEERQEDTFPSILMIAPRQSQAVAMNDLVLELATAARTPPLPVFVTTHGALKAIGPLRARWWDTIQQDIANPFDPDSKRAKGTSSWKQQ